jgi:superfamily II DNA/RNA helicase
LQIANTLINFELPWNPAKKNQRIGRIDRLGQRSSNLTIYNLITIDSIEQQIAAGLLIKQNLFDSVLDDESNTDYVDFSSKGRSQFVDQLEAFINQTETSADAGAGETGAEETGAEETGADDTSTDASSLDTPEAIITPEDELDEDRELVYPKDEDTDKSQAPAAGAPAKEVPQKQEPLLGESESKAAELEQVMTSGMQFLAGLFKMSTGKDLELEDQHVAFDKETGEVTMKFKLPV